MGIAWAFLFAFFNGWKYYYEWEKEGTLQSCGSITVWLNIPFANIVISKFLLEIMGALGCAAFCWVLGFFQVAPQFSLVTFWWCEHMLTSRKLWCELVVPWESGSSFSYLIKLESSSDSQRRTAPDCAKENEVLGRWKN